MLASTGRIFVAIAIALSIAFTAAMIGNAFYAEHPYGPDAVTIETAQAGGTQGEKVAEVSALDLLASADTKQGKKLSRSCAACHSFNKGGKDKIGPNIWDVVNAEIGARDFKYSEALMSKGGIWDYAALDAFLRKPRDYIPGTKMGYNGLKKPEDRAALIVWLRSLSDSPAPLPAE